MKLKKLTYQGRVTPEGEIKFPRRLRSELVANFIGKEIEVTFKHIRRMKTNPQLAYYWGVVIPYILQGFNEAGNQMPDNRGSRELIHSFLKRRFLPMLNLVDSNGEVHQVETSLADALKGDMGEYIDRCIHFAAEFLNTNVPAPGEQAEINF